MFAISINLDPDTLKKKDEKKKDDENKATAKAEDTQQEQRAETPTEISAETQKETP